MVCKIRAGFAMLIVLLLPLQGYAAMPTCSERVPANVRAAASAVQHHCTPAKTAAHQHNCSHGCCGAAMALTAARFIAPRSSAAEITCSAIAYAPEGALERLDRPPRFVPA
jgi:hypothetical protein